MKYFIIGIFLSSVSMIFGQTTILLDNFDLGSNLDQWTLIDNDGNTVASSVEEYTEAWILKEDPADELNGVVSSTSYFSPVDRADRWLITPLLTLGDESNYISWIGKSHDPSFPDSYKVMISTTGNALEDFTDTLTVVSNEYPEWTTHELSLDMYAGQPIYIAFVNTTFDGFKLYLDDVFVRSNDPLAVPQEEIKVALYPNPVVDYLNVVTENNVIQSIRLYDLKGQLIKEKEMTSQEAAVSINLEDLTSGLYFIKVRTNKGSFAQKIVK